MKLKRRIEHLERLYFPDRHEQRNGFTWEEFLYLYKASKRYDNLPSGSNVPVPLAYQRLKKRWSVRNRLRDDDA